MSPNCTVFQMWSFSSMWLWPDVMATELWGLNLLLGDCVCLIWFIQWTKGNRLEEILFKSSGLVLLYRSCFYVFIYVYIVILVYMWKCVVCLQRPSESIRFSGGRATDVGGWTWIPGLCKFSINAWTTDTKNFLILNVKISLLGWNTTLFFWAQMI